MRVLRHRVVELVHPVDMQQVQPLFVEQGVWSAIWQPGLPDATIS